MKPQEICMCEPID
jgi:hypothetical protein